MPLASRRQPQTMIQMAQIQITPGIKSVAFHPPLTERFPRVNESIFMESNQDECIPRYGTTSNPIPIRIPDISSPNHHLDLVKVVVK